MLTEGEAACYIYNLEVTAENEENALKRLQEAGLEPVYLNNSDPDVAFALGSTKINREPWKFKRFLTSSLTTAAEQSSKRPISDVSSDTSFEVSVPISRRSVLELLKLIMPPSSTGSTTTTQFMSEDEIYDVIVDYFPENHNITADKLNYWMSQDGSWGTAKRRQINSIRMRGRTINLIKEEYRDFTLDDITNIKEYRRSVRTSTTNFVTLGYARKSKSEKSEVAIVNSINLQIFKLKTKLLCDSIFASYCSANEYIHDRDEKKKTKFVFNNCAGDTQDLISTISISTKKVRLAIIDYAGLSTSPDDIRVFVRNYRQIKEIVVDVGNNVEVFSRHDLLHEDKIINKFRCRKACVKRS